jgi:hypothetical protein
MEVLILVWILGAILCGIVAGAKRRSVVGWALASFIFSPLLVLLALIAVPALPGRDERPRRGGSGGGCLACGSPVDRGERLCDECRA